MRRHLPLLCATALLSWAGAASAHHSLTLSGTMDMGVLRGYDSQTRVDSISRSHLAFSGTEDLGGGLSTTFKLAARFHLSGGIPEDPQAFWSGESTLGLKGAFGHVRMGRAPTALWQNDWAFDPWYNYDSIASPAWWLWHGNSPADPNVSTTGASFARLNRGVFYDSPVVGGFSGHLSAQVTENPADKKRGVSMAAKYGQGPLSLMVAREQTPANNRVTFLGLKYTSGAWALMGAYDHERLDAGGRNRSATLGLQYTVGATTFNVGYGRQLDHKAHFVGLGAVHALSKRTNAYVSLGHQGRQLWGRADAGTAWGIGLNHSF